MSNRLMNRLRSPDAITDAIQILKITIAATASWWLAVNVFETEFPFLAPWVALLTVHATVYRSLNRGLQTTISSVLGVGLAFVIGSYLGVGVWSFALALLVGLIVSRVKWIKDEGVTVATTAIFVLSSGYADDEILLFDRLIEVGLGVGVGIAVNLLLVPPLRETQAARYVDDINRRMGEILIGIADDLTDSWDGDRAAAWVSETESIDHEVDTAWDSALFARESRRANPRLRRPLPRGRREWRNRRPRERAGYEEILERISEGSSHLRHLARTLRATTVDETPWNTEFRHTWVAIVRDAGHAIKDPDAEVEPIYDRLTALADRFSGSDHLAGAEWALFGSLVTSMRHIAVIVDDVASAREARDASRQNPT